MRISDWSSDVCSSDLLLRDEHFGPLGNRRYKDYATVVHDSGSYLLRIVNDLLDLSKVEAGKLDASLEEVDAREAVTATVRMLAGLAKEAGIEVRVDISDDFPPLRTDQRRLEQVRSEEHTSELQSLMRISYAVFCLKNKTTQQ